MGSFMKSLFASFTVVALVILAVSSSSSTLAVKAYEDPAKPEFYTTRVKPIFDANCARCHGGLNHRGGLNMDTRESLLKGGHDGAVIVPGDPAKSTLVKLIRHEGPADDPKNMPPNKDKLADADIQTVEMWIKAGAVMPPPAPK
jgi:mono/diheme cytochrome c family protein